MNLYWSYQKRFRQKKSYHYSLFMSMKKSSRSSIFQFEFSNLTSRQVPEVMSRINHHFFSFFYNLDRQSYTISEDHSTSTWFAFIELCQGARSTVVRYWPIFVVFVFRISFRALWWVWELDSDCILTKITFVWITRVNGDDRFLRNVFIGRDRRQWKKMNVQFFFDERKSLVGELEEDNFVNGDGSSNPEKIELDERQSERVLSFILLRSIFFNFRIVHSGSVRLFFSEFLTRSSTRGQ